MITEIAHLHGVTANTVSRIMYNYRKNPENLRNKLWAERKHDEKMSKIILTLAARSNLNQPIYKAEQLCNQLKKTDKVDIDP